YLRAALPGKKISADLFGLSTSAEDDLGIGQVIENGYRYFDYVCPMVYPSHYASGADGFKNPAEHPYEIVSWSMARATARLNALRAEAGPTTALANVRPWLRSFDLGARYPPAMTGAQIKAVDDTIGKEGNINGGFLMWDPKNTYVDYDAFAVAHPAG